MNQRYRENVRGCFSWPAAGPEPFLADDNAAGWSAVLERGEEGMHAPEPFLLSRDAHGPGGERVAHAQELGSVAAPGGLGVKRPTPSE